MAKIYRILDTSTLALDTVTKSYVDGSLSVKTDFTYDVIQDASINLALNSILGNILPSDISIYVYESGSDVSGDGTAGNPYKTIYKALSRIAYNMDNHAVDILLGPGTFYYDASCDYIRTQQANGEITLIGTRVDDVSNLVVKQMNPTTDPFTYDVSVDGVTPSWTNNQWRKFFIDISNGNRTTSRPIANSSTWTLEFADPSLKNYSIIYHLDTSIYLASDLYTGQVQFRKCKVWLPDDVKFQPISNNFLLNHVDNIFSATNGTESMLSMVNSQAIFSDNYTENIRISGTNFSSLTISTSVCFGSISTSMAASWTAGSIGHITNCIIMKDSPMGYGIQYSVKGNTSISSIRSSMQHLKFKNVNYPLFLYNGYLEYGDNFKMYLENCPYLIRMGNGENTVGVSRTFGSLIWNGDIIGTPTVRYFYDSGLLIKRYYDPPYMDIHLKNILYREVDPLKDIKLYNNSVNDISIGHISQNKSIHVDYTLQRQNAYVQGAFNIVSDGSNFSSSVDRYIKTGTSTTIVDASAITFNALIDASIIKWRVTVDSSGGDASLNYSMTRVMKYPLTL
jgi:hypothetical protein